MSVTEKLDVLAPFEIWEVLLDNSTIKFHSPLILTPVILDAGTPGECFFVEHPALDISAVGIDREELLSCLRSDIRMTWKRVVQKRDNELSHEDLTTKRNFLGIAEEVDYG